MVAAHHPRQQVPLRALILIPREQLSLYEAEGIKWLLLTIPNNRYYEPLRALILMPRE